MWPTSFEKSAKKMVEKFVLDCSVAAKWYLFYEDEVDLARKILLQYLAGQIEFHAPDLLKYELTNALTKARRTRRLRLSNKQSESSFRSFCELEIKFHSLPDSALAEAVAFSNQFYRSFFDSCYLWLAERLDCPWLTADRKFQGPHPLGFPAHRIRFLSSFHPKTENE